MKHYRSRSGLFLCTRITRGDIECDVVINFVVTHYTPGRPAVFYLRNGDPGYPAEPAEYEFEVTSIEFDGSAPDDAPWPITADERASLLQWFDAHYEDAYDCAVDVQDDDGPDPDRMRDERIDRELGDRL